jgi:hypothetical protein
MKMPSAAPPRGMPSRRETQMLRTRGRGARLERAFHRSGPGTAGAVTRSSKRGLAPRKRRRRGDSVQGGPRTPTLFRDRSRVLRGGETLSSVVGGPFDDRWHAPWHALAGNRASRRKCAQSSGRFRLPATPGNGWTTALGKAGADTASALRAQASQRRANRRRVRSGAFRRPGEAGACS